MFKTILKIVFFSLLTGITFIVTWQSIFEKLSDSELLIISAFALVIAAIIGYFLKDKYMPEKFGKAVKWVFLSIALLMLIYGTIGIISNHDIFTGKRYDEMAGIIPYLVLISSLIPVFMSYITKLFTRKNGNLQ